MAKSNPELTNHNSIIVDNGSEFSMVGFGGDATPKAVFPSVVGRAHTITDESKEVFVGTEALSRQSILRLIHPIEHGIVTNWEDMEQVT